MGHLIWGFYQIGSAEIDPLLNLIPLTFPKVEHSHKQLSDLYVGPLDLNLHFMAWENLFVSLPMQAIHIIKDLV